MFIKLDGMCKFYNIFGTLIFSVKHGHCTGVQSINYDVNCAFSGEVQSFIINTNSFSVATV